MKKMDIVGEKGDIVIYTGDTSYIKDQLTKDIMDRDLEIGKEYIVYGYTGNIGRYKNHYTIIIDELSDYRFFPIKSFELSNRREYLKIKYNLK